jgi:two-component system, cell cycle sensor histidine kinase DivJ
VLRIVDLVSVVAGRLAALVHESARRDPQERSRHERFIRTRMVAGVVALGCLPLYLASRAATAAPDYLALLCLTMPMVAAVVLSRTGMLATSYAVSSAGFAGLVVIGAASGGTASPALVWLLAAPLEALLSGSRRAAVATAVIAVLGLLPSILQMANIGRLAETGVADAALPLLLITAVAHALAQAVGHASVEEAPEQRRTPELEELSFLQEHGDLITWHDRSGQVLRTGGAAPRLCGAPPNALLGRGLFSRVHVADRPAFLKALSDAGASDRPVVVQFRMHRRDSGRADAQPHPRLGSVLKDHESDVIWAEMRAHRVAQDGDHVLVVAVSRDISAYMRGAEELEIIQRKADRASAAKGQFLATVGHELRAPLNAVIGFSEVLAKGAGPALDERRRNDYLQIIREAGDHLLQVIDTLQDTAKIEAGRFDFAPAPFDVGALAHGCCDLMSLEAKRAGLSLVRDIAPDLPEMVADRRACKQMLLNLLSNAIKFTPRGGRVAVALHRNRDRLVFSVADTGIGIAGDALPRLGNPFFQVSSGQARQRHGTGLGLAVVRGLVGLHRGTLAIESAPDDGTSVIISLPIDCGPGAAQTGAPVRIHTIARPRPQLPAVKVG